MLSFVDRAPHLPLNAPLRRVEPPVFSPATSLDTLLARIRTLARGLSWLRLAKSLCKGMRRKRQRGRRRRRRRRLPKPSVAPGVSVTLGASVAPCAPVAQIPMS